MANSNKLNFMNSIQVKNPNKSVFDLTHDVKLSCNMGFLVPSMVFDVVPGDKISVNTEALIRFAPLVSPMFHRCSVTFHTWFVPYRILWENWADYITETKTGGVLPAFPFIDISDNVGSWTQLYDYLGIPQPIVGGSNERVNAMRMAAYQCIYNEFYRDENLIPEVNYALIDGDNSANADLEQIRKRAWQHDYFTSNLPFAQKGDAVVMPTDFNDVRLARNTDPGPNPLTTVTISAGQGAPSMSLGDNLQTADPGIGDNFPYAVTSELNAGTATINDLRLAEQLQKYLERAARAGTRLVEWIKGMFGVDLPDYTAQRPQYIGGTKSPVQISEVLNTAGTVGELPQGNMSGRGISVAQGNQGSHFAREHGVVMTIMSIMPETAYQQGLEREWSKINDPKDFLNPLFAHLGEQETKAREIMAFHTDSDQTFGYLPRYSEYRTVPNRVAGDFRTTLNYWTMSRIFDTTNVPVLNQEFIECDATHRVFADTDVDDQKMYVHCLNRVRAVRPLPKYGTPSL
ncbi:MAG: major capsid protein [Microvirus sp.]|nr:MAG: major capsid protein [Microvirus sp.]